MSCEDELHIGDIGTELLVTMTKCEDGVKSILDVSSATVKEITITKPDGSKVIKPTVFTSISSGGTGDGTDGKLSYFLVSGDLNISGLYLMQVRVKTTSGEWYGSLNEFKVRPNL